MQLALPRAEQRGRHRAETSAGHRAVVVVVVVDEVVDLVGEDGVFGEFNVVVGEDEANVALVLGNVADVEGGVANILHEAGDTQIPRKQAVLACQSWHSASARSPAS